MEFPQSAGSHVVEHGNGHQQTVHLLLQIEIDPSEVHRNDLAVFHDSRHSHAGALRVRVLLQASRYGVTNGFDYLVGLLGAQDLAVEELLAGGVDHSPAEISSSQINPNCTFRHAS